MDPSLPQKGSPTVEAVASRIITRSCSTNVAFDNALLNPSGRWNSVETSVVFTDGMVDEFVEKVFMSNR